MWRTHASIRFSKFFKTHSSNGYSSLNSSLKLIKSKQGAVIDRGLIQEVPAGSSPSRGSTSKGSARPTPALSQLLGPSVPRAPRREPAAVSLWRRLYYFSLKEMFVHCTHSGRECKSNVNKEHASTNHMQVREFNT